MTVPAMPTIFAGWKFHCVASIAESIAPVNARASSADGGSLWTIALGHPDRADLQAHHLERVAGFGANQFGRAAADIDDQQRERWIDRRPHVTARCDRLGFLEPADGFELDAGALAARAR